MCWDKIRKLWEHINQQQSTQNPLSRERGQSLVEFAIILPVLLLLVLGTIDLGMGFRTYIALTNASREGARWISIHPSDRDGAEDRIDEEAFRVGLEASAFSAGGYDVEFSPDPDETHLAAGVQAEVSIHYDYELLFGAITGLPTIPFTASSTMVVLYDE